MPNQNNNKPTAVTVTYIHNTATRHPRLQHVLLHSSTSQNHAGGSGNPQSVTRSL